MPVWAPEAYQYPATQTLISRANAQSFPIVRRGVVDSNRTDAIDMQDAKTISRAEPAIYGLTARWPAFLTICLGLVLLYFAGFSPTPQFHNSAHDTRHSNGFPCH